MGNFTLLAGEALYNDNSMNLTADQAVFISQLIAEWSFHKSIDLIRSGVMPEYWDGVMQKIAFTIFEVAKQTISKGISQDEILKVVEHHVKKAYMDALTELKEKNLISPADFDAALGQSNIDKMAQENELVLTKEGMEALEKELSGDFEDCMVKLFKDYGSYCITAANTVIVNEEKKIRILKMITQ